MSQEVEGASGGARITPSARPSIHNYRNSRTVDGESDGKEENIMGRFNTKGYTSTSKNESNQEGIDEVDNVQSKFLRGPSPRRNIKQKRNSVDLPVTPYLAEDLDDSKDFAKSLPASLPSHSHCSDEFGCWSDQASPNVSYESSRHIHSNQSIERSDFERSSFEANASTPERSVNLSKLRHEEQKTNGQSTIYIVIGAIVALVLAVYYTNFLSNTSTEDFNKDKYNFLNFQKDLNSLKEKYKIPGDSMLQIQAGISTIFEREDTGSFVLAYQSNKIDPDEFEDLINNIASTAVRYLRNDTEEIHHIVVDGPKLEMHTHSELINRYKEDVEKRGVMLVRELDGVPSALAMAFHYYCDEYNPLVKKSAIFFTLDMTKCSHREVEQTPTHAQIEKCLQRKWSGVPKDNINPLLNRVVNTVVDITGD